MGRAVSIWLVLLVLAALLASGSSHAVSGTVPHVDHASVVGQGHAHPGQVGAHPGAQGHRCVEPAHRHDAEQGEDTGADEATCCASVCAGALPASPVSWTVAPTSGRALTSQACGPLRGLDPTGFKRPPRPRVIG